MAFWRHRWLFNLLDDPHRLTKGWSSLVGRSSLLPEVSHSHGHVRTKRVPNLHQLRWSSSQHPMGDDIFASNVAKALAFVFIGAGCWAVLPKIGKSSIGHAVGLLGAKDMFLVRSGLSRLKFLARSEDYAERIVDDGGIPKLVKLLNPKTDKDALVTVIQILEKLSTFHSSRRFLKAAGLEDKITEGTKEGWLGGDEMDEEIKTILWELNSPLVRTMS